ncbi:MAG: T9SS type A sorting domain-containing protein [Calditrichia bacterium]
MKEQATARTPVTLPTKYFRIVTRILMLCVGMMFYGQTGYGQAGTFSGPAFGSVTGGVLVSTENFKNSPSIIEPEGKKVHNPFWEKYNPDYYGDVFNVTPALAPLNSNEYQDNVSLKNATSQPPTVLASFESIPQGNSIPPDPIMAVGPDHIISCVNTSFEIYDKGGNRLFRSTADAWYSNILPNAGAFDPVIFFDHFEQRWVMLWDNFDEASVTAFYLMSVSDDANPLGEWYNYALPAHLNGSNQAFNWGDFPKMGFDDKAVYISGRMFSLTGGGFNYCKVRIVPKDQFYANTGGPVDYTDFWNFRDPANPNAVVDGPPIAASHMDSTNTTYIVVDAPYNTSTFISLWKLTDPLGTNPTLVGVNVPTTAALGPPDSRQPGGTQLIDGGRRAYRNAVYQDGFLWTATAVAGGIGNQSAFTRYVKVDVNANTAVEDFALGEDNFFHMYPAIAVDDENNIFISYSRSGDTEFAGAAFTGRRESDFPGLAPTSIIKEGEAYYDQRFGGARNRWGDYMGIHTDPKFPNIVWGLMEYAGSPSSTWRTWVGAFAYNFYGAGGTISDASNSDPIQFAKLTLVESGQESITGAAGDYQLISPIVDPTFSVTSFAYQPTTVNPTLLLNDTTDVNITMQPEVQATITGQIKDLTSGAGVQADIELWAEGNPFPGPYQSISTDASGNYSVSTIIGNYEVRVLPILPYPDLVIADSLTLEAAGATFDVEISIADVFVIDDDEGSDYEGLFSSAFTDADISSRVWSVMEDGLPSANEFNQFVGSALVWYTGDGAGTTLTAAEQTLLLDYLNADGKLLLTGQNIAEQNDATALLTQLGVGFSNNIGFPVVGGIAGEFTEGLTFSTLGGDGAANQTSRDVLSISNATTTRSVFLYGANANNISGAAYENGDSRAVVLGFGFEGINSAGSRADAGAAIVNFLKDGAVGIEPIQLDGNVPAEFDLAQNYPNPFNPETTISFAVAENAQVTLEVFNMLGQRISLLTNQKMQPGNYEVVWNGQNDFGQSVPSGVYLYRLQTSNGFQKSMKMLLVK